MKVRTPLGSFPLSWGLNGNVKFIHVEELNKKWRSIRDFRGTVIYKGNIVEIVYNLKSLEFAIIRVNKGNKLSPLLSTDNIDNYI